MNELVLVRCIVCEVMGMSGTMFNNINDTFPVKIVGILPTPTGVRNVKHDAYVCAVHYERFERIS